MDYRWALLAQTFSGQSFSPVEMARLFDPRLNPADLAAVLEAVSGHALARPPRPWLERAQSVWEKSIRAGVRWSYIGQPDYPSLWNHMSRVRPLVFSYQGEPVWTRYHTVSVVGSRTPMRGTCLWLQKELSRFVRETNFVVVSGGARGVDQWAHRVAVDAGHPTVCVLPSGLLKPYPAEHHGLFARILEGGGALVSTFALEQTMRRHLFVVRNRWIVGLSAVTFVVEANRRSGSALSAKLAGEESRTVCTLPVSPFGEQGLYNLDLLALSLASVVRDARDLKEIATLNTGRWSGLRL